MNKSIKKLPKIGIRPIIDSREIGVNESVERQTMKMADSVSRFLTENLRHSNGDTVECVVARKCIGGIADSIETDEKFEKEGIKITLSVTPTWCYGFETMDMNPYNVKAIWGFNGTERPGAVYLAAVLAAHNQKGLPAFSIYGKEVQDKEDESIPSDVQKKLLSFAKAALAFVTMQNRSYLSIGSASMGIAGSIVDPDFFEDYLGMRVEYVDMSEIKGRIEKQIFSHLEFEKAIKWIKNNCIEGKDKNLKLLQKSQKEKEKDWEIVTKMTMIIRDLMIGNSKLAEEGFYEESLGHNAIAAGFQGQRQWTDYFQNGDFSETILNSSFDWNGIREAFIVSTENDCLNAVTMLFGHLLTDTAQIFADVRTYWSAESIKRVTGEELSGISSDGIIHLINSGSACLDGTGQQILDGKPALKPYWEITDSEVRKMLKSSTFYPANLVYFKGGGFSVSFLTQGNMPVTMSRINIVKGLGPTLQIAEGYTVNLPKRVHDILNERTDPTWPTTWFVPILTGRGAFRDVYSVMGNWGANHSVVCFGHIGAGLITLASMLRIPVCMHNVPDEKIFRPSVWNTFGTDDLQGADFRTCTNFGPVFGKMFKK